MRTKQDTILNTLILSLSETDLFDLKTMSEGILVMGQVGAGKTRGRQQAYSRSANTRNKCSRASRKGQKNRKGKGA
jgi:hypothetical protein